MAVFDIYFAYKIEFGAKLMLHIYIIWLIVCHVHLIFSRFSIFLKYKQLRIAMVIILYHFLIIGKILSMIHMETSWSWSLQTSNLQDCKWRFQMIVNSSVLWMVNIFYLANILFDKATIVSIWIRVMWICSFKKLSNLPGLRPHSCKGLQNICLFRYFHTICFHHSAGIWGPHGHL